MTAATRDPRTGKFIPAVESPVELTKESSVVEVAVDPEPELAPMLAEYECPLCRTPYWSGRTICSHGGTGRDGDDLVDHEPSLVVLAGVES